MDVQMMDIKDIHPYAKNPRRNDDAVQSVANSIRDFGFKQPIVVDRDMVIIVGHTRYKAAKKLKLKQVPVLVADDLTEEQAKAYRIADNSTNGLATWDYDLLLPEIEGLDFDMGDYGLNLTDTEEVSIPTEAVEDNYQEPEELEPVVKLGEIWRCGDHVLMCGSSTNEDDIRKLVKEGGGRTC